MKAFVTINEAARYLSVCTKTIRRWDKAGKIACARTPGNYRRIAIVEINRVMTRNESEKKTSARNTAIYGRVSPHEQKKKGNLQRQVQRGEKYCQERGYTSLKVFQDTGNGLNARRRGLRKLSCAIERGEIERVVLTYNDRLTRFGFDYLVRYFSSHGTTIEVIEQEKDGGKEKGESRSLEKELVDDLIAIVTS